MDPNTHIKDAKIIFRLSLLIVILILSGASLFLLNRQDKTVLDRGEDQDKELMLVSELLAADHMGAVGGIRQLLTSMSVSYEYIKDKEGFCRDIMTKQTVIFPYFINIGMVDTAGNIICSGASVAQNFNFKDDPTFQEFQRTKSFTMSGSIISSTGWPAVRYFEPHVTHDGEYTGAFFATFATQWLNGFPASFVIPSNIIITKFDRSGTVFMRYPNPTEWTGTHQSESELFNAVQKTKRGIVSSKGLDGIERKYYVRPILLDGKIDSYIAVGKSM